MLLAAVHAPFFPHGQVPANFADPWRKHSQVASSGTGFLLEELFETKKTQTSGCACSQRLEFFIVKRCES
eukprot:2301073-Amphidinium_carterae.1